jgi:hypothetical protein
MNIESECIVLYRTNRLHDVLGPACPQIHFILFADDFICGKANSSAGAHN